MTAYKLLLGVALLTSGCDDPEVESKVATALVYGAVQAVVVCEGTVDSVGCDMCPYRAKVSRLIDGSTHMSVNWKSGWSPFDSVTQSELFDRTETLSVNLPTAVSTNPVTVSVGPGELVFDFVGSFCGSSPLDLHPVVDLTDPECDGRNLEAFGVE